MILCMEMENEHEMEGVVGIETKRSSYCFGPYEEYASVLADIFPNGIQSLGVGLAWSGWSGCDRV